MAVRHKQFKVLYNWILVNPPPPPALACYDKWIYTVLYVGTAQYTPMHDVSGQIGVHISLQAAAVPALARLCILNTGG